MIFNKITSKQFIEEKLGFPVNNWNMSMIMTRENTVSMYTNHLGDNDYYFIPFWLVSKTPNGESDYSLLETKKQIYKLEAKILKDYKTTSAKMQGDKVFFDFNLATQLWHEDTGLVSQAVQTPASQAVQPQSVPIPPPIFTDEEDDGPIRPGDKLPFNTLTQQDFASIILKLPDSKKQWLNGMIITRNKIDDLSRNK